MTLTSRMLLELSADFSSALDLASLRVPLDVKTQVDLANGTAANQADRIFHDTRTLSASGTENLDLAGVLTDPTGATITFAKIKLLLIKAAAANTNDVVVGGHASAAFVNWVSDATDKVVVRPGGGLCLWAPGAAGYAVTATTADMLTVANSGAGTGVTYDVVIIGTSA